MRIVPRVALVLGILAAGTFAAIKALTLSELMEITTDAAHVRITASAPVHLDWPMEGAVWTRLSIEGVSLRTSTPVKTDVMFLGSHEAAERFTISEMPTLQDSRVGNEAIVFWWDDPDMPGGGHRVFDLSGVYRVEQAFGAPVVIGKGEGFAWSQNVKVSDAAVQVRNAHLELAAKQAAQKPAGK